MRTGPEGEYMANLKGITITARPKRYVTAAVRRKIAAAQRARWAKINQQKKAA
jgi:hypothetical protein